MNMKGEGGERTVAGAMCFLRERRACSVGAARRVRRTLEVENRRKHTWPPPELPLVKVFFDWIRFVGTSF